MNNDATNETSPTESKAILKQLTDPYFPFIPGHQLSQATAW